MAAILNLGPHRRGDTIAPISFDVLINNLPPPSPIASVAIDLRREGRKVYRIDSALGTISVTGDGSFTILSFVFSICAHAYDYDIQITYTDGTVKTYVQGVWTVQEDITE